MEALIAKLNETYKAIDAELKLYSEKANANDPTARQHLANEEKLREEAHAITRKLTSGKY